MTFATKLRQIRELRKLSQKDLADRAGMQPSAIAHFEGGRREPSLSNFLVLCKALRVNAAVLAGQGGESIYDTLTMEEIEFINLFRDAVIAKHKRDIKEREKQESHTRRAGLEVKGE